jgi:hypothetical protein
LAHFSARQCRGRSSDENVRSFEVLSDACLPRVARLNSKLLSCLGRKVRVYTELRAPNKHRPQT